MKKNQPDRLPHEKGFHISWDQMHRDSRALAWRLDVQRSWKGVLAVTRGGMIPAMIVSRELDIRTVDTISIKSYDHQKQAEAVILKKPDPKLVGDGNDILIIDDLVDTGKTLKANGLEPQNLIADISSRVIVNKASMKIKHKIVSEIIGLLGKAVKNGNSDLGI